jgi:ubiquinone/menaquinone biosynthesis C-methylase UbiE
MPRDTYSFSHESERQHAVHFLEAYFKQKPEQVKAFEAAAAERIKEKPEPRILDAACGLGDLSHYLSELNPRAHFVGLERAPFLVSEARRLNTDNPQLEFVEGDLMQLKAQLGGKSFDFSVCKQTLSWLPHYAEAMKQLIAVTREAIWISSLFYEGRIDFETRIREYVTDVGREDFNAYYNVYSLPIFEEFCLANGAKRVTAQSFEIGIDLPRGDPDRMGTYTVRLENGGRLQMSGALALPWKIVTVET